MTTSEINSLTVEATIYELVRRVMDWEEGKDSFELSDNTELSIYDRLVFEAPLIKPLLSELNNELGLLKTELLVIENARLGEIARVSGIEARWFSMSDIQGAIGKSGLSIGNAALELARIIKENDVEALEALEAFMASFEADLAAKLLIKSQADALDSMIDLNHGCVKIVMKHNIGNGLTKEQKDQQAISYSNLFEALDQWRIGKFKSLVTNLEPDGVLVRQELKDELLEYITLGGV